VELRHGPRRQNGMRRLAWAAVIAMLAAGCASSPQPRVSSHPVGWVPAPHPPPSAVAFASRLLDDAVLPPGVKPYAESAPHWLASDPDGTPALVNLVQAHRLWTLQSTAANVAGFLQAHRPDGFTGGGIGSLGTLRSRTDRALFVDDQLLVLPSNISNAQLDVAVTDVGSGTVVIRADAQVAWTKPRPKAEFVPIRDHVVILTVTHLDGPKRRRGKRVVATSEELVQPIVRSFNQLRVSAPAYFGECAGDARLQYQVAFARSPGAPPDLVASIGPCSGVGATAGERTLPGLVPSGAFSTSVAHLLGSSELH
jgi:hypothetical protein